MENKKEYFECSCSGEILRVEKWDDEFEELSLSMFSLQNYPWYLPFWDRVKLSFRILFKGEMFADDMILDKDSAKKLKDWLNENYKD